MIRVKCKRCGRWLTNPISIRRGYGRVCFFKKMKVSQLELKYNKQFSKKWRNNVKTKK
jgi:hypothetical protein